MREWSGPRSKPNEDIHVDVFFPSALQIASVKLFEAEGTAGTPVPPQKQALHFLGITRRSVAEQSLERVEGNRCGGLMNVRSRQEPVHTGPVATVWSRV